MLFNCLSSLFEHRVGWHRLRLDVGRQPADLRVIDRPVVKHLLLHRCLINLLVLDWLLLQHRLGLLHYRLLLLDERSLQGWKALDRAKVRVKPNLGSLLSLDDRMGLLVYHVLWLGRHKLGSWLDGLLIFVHLVGLQIVFDFLLSRK